jgi:3,4-dihydroxy 2-butanone 4-phosphate synthase/GTP cyclohydrolase II
VDQELHVALVLGEPAVQDSALVRVHSQCLSGDVFSSQACDCHEIIERSLEAIAAERSGVFVYLHHTGRGFHIRGAADAGEVSRIIFHERGQLDQDLNRQRIVQRESGVGAQILNDLGLRRIRVLTNHPKKVVALEGYGLELAGQVPLHIGQPRVSHQSF